MEFKNHHIYFSSKMQQILVFLLCYLSALYITVKAINEVPVTKQLNGSLHRMSDEHSGDPKLCIEQSNKKNIGLRRFAVLPGVGWDNLRNTEAGMVASFTFNDCRTTDDGLFLLPDHVFTVPVKYSKVEQFAEIIENWQQASSSTSRTINVHVGGGFLWFRISGKFSYEHSEMKTRQYQDKSVTIRVKLQYIRYEVKLQPDSQLSPQFKKRLLHIADNLKQDQRKQAQYEAQLLIREFGTHILTSITAGAALVKDDYLRKTFVEDSRFRKTEILAQASVSFGIFFKASTSYKSVISDAVKTGYSKSLTQSYVKTYGGPLFLPNEFSLDKWASNVDMNIVPMDRDGEPLNFLINSQTLPELEPSLVVDLEAVVRQAINTYYEMNVIRGCTKPDDPNFSLAANVDDGMCQSLQLNSTFGGIYRTCSVIGSFVKNNPCNGMERSNPKTGQRTCPPEFLGVKIFTETNASQIEFQPINCTRCRYHRRRMCCNEIIHVATPQISTYWCAQLKKTKLASGFMFGGLYTSTSVNPFTGLRKCPPHFYELEMTSVLKVCVCDDTELCLAAAIPFGGFFTCEMGNPHAVARTHLDESGTGYWPKSCPDGYSQHLLMNDDGCSVHYCTRTGALSTLSLPPVRRPPFMQQPSFARNDKQLDMVQVETELDAENGTEELTVTVYGKSSESLKIAAQSAVAKNWKHIVSFAAMYQKLQGDTSPETSQSHINAPDKRDALSSADVAGIAAGSIFGLLAIVLVAVFAVRYRTRSKRRSYDTISEEKTVLIADSETTI